MEIEFIIALIVAIPVVLFPALLIWYMNIGWIRLAFERAKKFVLKRA